MSGLNNAWLPDFDYYEDSICVVKESNIPMFVMYFGAQKNGKLYQRRVYGWIELTGNAGGFLSGVNSAIMTLVTIFLYVKSNSRLIQIILSQQLELLEDNNREHTIDNIKNINSVTFLLKYTIYLMCCC